MQDYKRLEDFDEHHPYWGRICQPMAEKTSKYSRWDNNC
jgi:hypothetical protein